MTAPHMRPYEYTLVGHTPIACGSELGWAMERAKAKRLERETGVDPWRVGLEEITTKRGKRVSHCEISTVFLGIDHGYLRGDGGDPVLFETMVFHGPLDGQMARYTSWEDAARGHAAMVEIVRTAVAQVNDIWHHAHKRPSRGWRRHVRRTKALERQHG